MRIQGFRKAEGVDGSVLKLGGGGYPILQFAKKTLKRTKGDLEAEEEGTLWSLGP